MSLFEKYKNLSPGRSFIENEMRMNRMRQNKNLGVKARKIEMKPGYVGNLGLKVPTIDPKFGVAPLPFNEKPRVIADARVKSKQEKKEEKQMKEVYDKVILNGGKKKTAEEKIMDQVINGK